MYCRCDPFVLSQIKALVAPALRGPREQRALRLQQMGYAIERKGEKRLLVTLPHGLPVMELAG